MQIGGETHRLARNVLNVPVIRIFVGVCERVIEGPIRLPADPHEGHSSILAAGVRLLIFFVVPSYRGSHVLGLSADPNPAPMSLVCAWLKFCQPNSRFRLSVDVGREGK